MKFAFLFLTYDNIYNFNVWSKFIDNDNVYIHAKFPNKLEHNLKKYLISNLVKTEWRRYSIVKATLNLLKEAYTNTDNEYFILLSSDSYPLFSKNTFIKKFTKLNNNNSIFYFTEMIHSYYKSYQWWILSRNDAKIILETENKYYTLFSTLNIEGTAIDEIYFLSVLHLENPSYKYNNYSSIYCKWIKYSKSFHPLTLNKITEIDLKEIKKSNSYFIRKVLNNFELKPIKYKNILYILCIGDLTNQQLINSFIKNNKEKCDFIVLSSTINNNLKINLENILYIYYTNYKYFYNNFFEICIEYNKLLRKYIDGVIFVTESFILDKNYIDDTIISNTKNIIYYKLKDSNNNNAYYTLIFSSKFRNKIKI